MLMTEEEARVRWCPFARVLNGHEDGPYNRTNGGDTFYPNPVKARCIASQCMAWRWMKGQGCLDGSNEWVQRGYCGLAGVPEPLFSEDGLPS